MKKRAKQMAGGLLTLVIGMVLSMGDLFFILRVGGILSISWVLLLMTGGFLINHRWWKPISQIFILISLLLGGVIGGINLKSSYNTHASKKLIETLEVYNTQMGNYPTNLIELLPIHYASIPNYIGVWSSQPFEYSYSPDENEFRLGYSADNFVIEYYYSKTKYWSGDSGI